MRNALRVVVDADLGGRNQMKCKFLISFLCTVFALGLQAEDVSVILSNASSSNASQATQQTDRVDITLRSGETYQNCKVTKTEPDGITVMHSKGIAKLPFSNLPEDYQKKYNYDPEKATAYAQAMAKQRAQTLARQQNESQHKRDSEEARQSGEKTEVTDEARKQTLQKLAQRRKLNKDHSREYYLAKATSTKAVAGWQITLITNMEYKVLIGASKEEVVSTMGNKPNETRYEGTLWVYRIVDSETQNPEEPIDLNLQFRDDKVVSVTW
jgi:hypothetical protein